MSQNKQKPTEKKKTLFKKPRRYFEKTGLVNPDLSYHIFLEKVTNSDNHDIKTMVDLGRYFSIFSPRQSGKTTFFRDFCRKLEKNAKYVTIRLNFENFDSLSVATFYQQIQKEFYAQLLDRLTEVGCQQLSSVKEFLESHQLSDHISFGDFFEGLNQIIRFKKIVIFIDEFDGIPLQELKNFLTSIRKLYQRYKEIDNKALYSIGLVGIRDITKLIVGGVSPFNIADEVSLPSFSLENIRELYSQHTSETNQPFAEGAIKKTHHMTGGQPWLVNRMGTILTKDIKPGITEAITDQDINKATNLLLREKNDHFTNLWEKLEGNETTFIDIASKEIPYSPYEKGQSWLSQFGLIKDENGKAVIANPIYRELFLPLLMTSPEFYEEKRAKKLSQEKGVARDKVFISYSHKDKKWMEKVRVHLSVLEAEGITCNLWDDSRIKAGMKWRQEIAEALQTAKVAILLVSTDFLASDFIRKKELLPLLDAVEKEGAVALPLIIKPCRFASHPRLSQFQTVNDPKNPLSKLSEDDQDEILLALMDRVAELVKGPSI